MNYHPTEPTPPQRFGIMCIRSGIGWASGWAGDHRGVLVFTCPTEAQQRAAAWNARRLSPVVSYRVEPLP